MARPFFLGLVAQKTIMDAVDSLFERAKSRLLGPGIGPKQLVIAAPKYMTMTGLFETASRLEGVQPREEVMRSVLRIAGSYLDAQKEKTKAQVVQKVNSFLLDAQAKGVETDVETVLGGQLSEVWRDMSKDVKRIVETETTTARNTGAFDAIGRIAAVTGREDPVVFFVVVRDGHRCDECTRLHLLPDLVTPRVWLASEVGAGYHKKGDENPKINGLHPHCRCTVTHLTPGYGFDSLGRIYYVGPDHDEFRLQRSQSGG